MFSNHKSGHNDDKSRDLVEESHHLHPRGAPPGADRTQDITSQLMAALKSSKKTLKKFEEFLLKLIFNCNS